jgi:hypothetical protein
VLRASKNYEFPLNRNVAVIFHLRYWRKVGILLAMPQYRTPPNARDGDAGIDLMPRIIHHIRNFAREVRPGQSASLELTLFWDGSQFNQVTPRSTLPERGKFVIL